MKFPRFGLRAEILLSLTVLLIAAMTLTSFVLLRITERNLLQYKTDDGMAVARKIQAVVEVSRKHGVPLSRRQFKERLQEGISWMAHSDLYGNIVVFGKDGTVWIGEEHLGASCEFDEGETDSVFKSGEPNATVNMERTLLTVTAPIFAGGECIAVANVPVRIETVTEGLRRSRLLIWFYMGLNVLVLVVFGNFLLSRIVIR
ncbi:MAG: hypothetical protein JRJ47_05355, partial [Deltaproteobacteria bacterium]|nr:hypothetical protein [Deltaproteobacteria bacterium]